MIIALLTIAYVILMAVAFGLGFVHGYRKARRARARLVVQTLEKPTWPSDEEDS